MPIRLCACGLSGAMRTLWRACFSASPALPRLSSSIPSLLTGQKFVGSISMRRCSRAAAAFGLPASMQISASVARATGRRGPASSTSRLSRSAVTRSPARRASAACCALATRRSPADSPVSAATGASAAAGSKLQQCAALRPLVQAQSWWSVTRGLVHKKVGDALRKTAALASGRFNIRRLRFEKARGRPSASGNSHPAADTLRCQP